ncbi:unnamed protein product [Aspergillus oryzae]|uniref:Autophagy-related protein n=2 Tax=Aspergillus oryzae TaxID=5062 RepID=A0AAN4YBQ7_ASPOZ|nr:unnamed protein product [Aspergillus oryzae]GMF85249.1 unnamed protein product [Aspergillus oryzae]GMG23119.1 unnamed protein product [Aspergillus oryzae]GMG42976.1 unnamed protein product [Aspergillus oryzae var. brunneus]
MMLCSILLFGALALPFAGLTKAEYSHLNGLATLYCLLTTVQGVYTVIEASYIPIFMRSVGGLHSASPAADPDTKRTWKKGFTVSVLALVASNVGGIVALLIGVILSYGIGSYVQVGYFSYLLAITIAGCITSKSISTPHLSTYLNRFMQSSSGPLANFSSPQFRVKSGPKARISYSWP